MSVLNKKLLSLTLSVLMLIVIFTGCGDRNNDKSSSMQDSSSQSEVIKSDATPLMWKASNSSGNYIYLFGSIHVGDDSLYELNDTILNAYNDSDVLAVEADVYALQSDLEASLSFSRALTYTDGELITDHISSETYNNVRKVLEDNNAYFPVLDKYKPFMWISTFSDLAAKQAGLNSTKGVDMYFLKKAHEESKTVVELESIEMQIDLMLNMSNELIEIMLNSYAEASLQEQADELTELYKVYKQGDEQKLLELTSESEELEGEDAELYNEYNKAMLDDRNVEMTKKAASFIENGEKTFYVVGAAHMVGDTGIIKALIDKGFTVEQIEY